MREIKFRAWDMSNKKMLYQDFIDPWVINSNGHIGFEWVSEEGRGIEWRNNCILMQSTLLRDKHGIQIYEGDIVKYKFPIMFDIEDCEFRIQDVFYDAGAWAPVYLMYHQFHDTEDKPMQIRDVEIIGNIYENTELKEKV